MSGPTKLWAVRAPSGAVVDTALSRSHAERLAREHGVILGTCACVEYVPASDLATVTAERDRLREGLRKLHAKWLKDAIDVRDYTGCIQAELIEELAGQLDAVLVSAQASPAVEAEGE